MSKASDTLKRKYGDDYFKRLANKSVNAYSKAQKSGEAKPRGFAVRKDLAKELGRKGGKISKRTKQS